VRLRLARQHQGAAERFEAGLAAGQRPPVLLPAFCPRVRASPSRRSQWSPPEPDLGLEAYISQRLGPDARDLYPEMHRELDRFFLPCVLEFTSGNQNQAARLLGIARQTLRQKLRDLGLHATHSVEADDVEPS